MVDRRQGAACEDVAAHTGESDDERKTQNQDDENLPELRPQPIFGSGNSENDGASCDKRCPGQSSPSVTVRNERLVARRSSRRRQRDGRQRGGGTRTIDLIAARCPHI